VLEEPTVVRAQCVVLDEFLAPQEMEQLIRYTQEHGSAIHDQRSDFSERGTRSYRLQPSSFAMLLELGPLEEVYLNRIRGVLPRVLQQSGMEEFPVSHTEAQITASNDGDFFRAHCDDAQEMIASRRLTFVYFFHREPSQFEEGVATSRLKEDRRTSP